MEKSWKYRSVIQKGIAVHPKYVWILGKPEEESEAVERLLEPLRNKDGTFSCGCKTMPGYLPLACPLLGFDCQERALHDGIPGEKGQSGDGFPACVRWHGGGL